MLKINYLNENLLGVNKDTLFIVK